MSSVTTPSDFSKINDWEELKRWVSTWAVDITNQVNGNLDFTSNLRCNVLDVSFAVANSTVTVKHKLMKTPTGYILVKSNVSTTIYDGVGDFDKDYLYLKSSAVANCRVLVF